MRIIVLQHHEVVGAGRLGATLRDHGFKLDVRMPHLHPVGSGLGLPSDLDDVHGLVILGGAQNVTDIEKYPWMQAEAALIQRAHEVRMPIIGICLGAQLIAHALGGQVAPREKPAVGFYEMDIAIPGQTEPLLGGIAWKSPQLLSCGQEIKQAPPGATVLASTKNTKVVMFKAGIRTFGSLAHFECDRELVDKLLAASRADMPGAGTTEGECRVQADQLYPTYGRLSDRLCVNLATLMFPSIKKLSA